MLEWVFEPDGSFSDCQFVFVNAAFEQITGMKKERIQGKLVHETLGVCDENWMKISRQVAENGVSERITIDNMPDGKRYTCNIYRPGESQSRICLILDEIRE